MTRFLSDILLPFPDSNHLNSRSYILKDIPVGRQRMCFQPLTNCYLNNANRQSQLIATYLEIVDSQVFSQVAIARQAVSQVLNGETVSKSCLIIVDIRIFFFPPISFNYLSPCLKLGLNRIGRGGGEEQRVQWLNEQAVGLGCSMQQPAHFQFQRYLTTISLSISGR